MTRQTIRLFGDPVLRTPAELVTTFDRELRTLVADLTETMLAAPGSGLAAPQIGVGLRVFTYHIDDEQAGHLINPVLHFPTRRIRTARKGACRYRDSRSTVPGANMSWRTGRTCGVTRSRSRARRSCPDASSTRPTISTGCCSSTG